MIKSILEDRLIKISFQISFFLFLASVFFIAVFWKKLPDQIPLFYSHPWGEEQLAKNFFLLIFPASTFVTILISLAIIKFSKEKLLMQIFSLTTAIISLMAFYGLIRIVFLVI